MTDLINKINTLEAETIENIKNSKAANTLRAYKSDYKDFVKFCRELNFSSMPANPKVVSLYLTNLSKISKYSTIKRRLAAIKVFHNLSGNYIDLKHPIINENLISIKRKIGSFQIAKKPLTIKELKKIITEIEIDKKNKSRDFVRNRALILIGFAGAFRRSELVSILIEDVDFVDEGVKILVKKSKTDQSGEGMIKAIPHFSNKDFCPVVSLKKWIEYLKIEKPSEKLVFSMSDKNVALIIKKFTQKAGLDFTKYAGHSLRSGFATSVAEAGAEERQIMAMTGHKSNQMVRRYIHESNLFKNNALKNLKI
jgi:site-specific recombinase XerD